MEYEISDLRTAIQELKTIPGQYRETDVEVDPICQLHGVYRYVGAGGTVAPPTREGPAVVFNHVKGYPGVRSLIGMFASWERVAALLGQRKEDLAHHLRQAVNRPVPPVLVPTERALCQQVVYRAEEPGFDLRKILPITQSTPEDAGPCITMGLCLASDPETGESDVTVHRMFTLDSPDELTFNYASTRHIGAMFEKAERLGQPLPISINIGLDPAVYLGASLEPPTTPYGYNELCVAGALRGRGVELAPCLTIRENCIANAEFVIEGELQPGVRVMEDLVKGSGTALPEFPGFQGTPHKEPIIKVKAITHRVNPIFQSLIGASEEHVCLAGPCMEASILDMTEKALPGFVRNVYAHPAGGGKFVAILQVHKRKLTDEGRQRQAALLAMSAFSELKHVFLVDEDVDLFCTNDVMWAMTMRYQGDVDTIFIPGTRYHRNDPSARTAYSPTIRADGAGCKAIFDCTVPYGMEKEFRRAQFVELDPKEFFPDMDYQ
ncbi:MAG: UbiD family decarboxylase [Oscillospiraceae bacterium]|nr:UbiD family decarboxylase [Oscillospiraceae bacterium]